MAEVIIYTTRWCPFCIRAKQLLKSKEVNYEEIAVDDDQQLRQEMMEKSGRRTVQHIGGCDELYGLEQAGALNGLLGQ